MIKVYTLPDCSQCDATKAFLKKNTLEFEAIDLAEHPNEFAPLKAMGFSRVPIVVTDSDQWSGFQPSKLFSLAQR